MNILIRFQVNISFYNKFLISVFDLPSVVGNCWSYISHTIKLKSCSFLVCMNIYFCFNLTAVVQNEFILLSILLQMYIFSLIWLVWLGFIKIKKIYFYSIYCIFAQYIRIFFSVLDLFLNILDFSSMYQNFLHFFKIYSFFSNILK